MEIPFSKVLTTPLIASLGLGSGNAVQLSVDSKAAGSEGITAPKSFGKIMCRQRRFRAVIR